MKSPNPYSNARAEARRSNPGVNTTQRSWSNYEGNKPVRSRVGSSFYGDSSKYGVGGTDVDRFGGGNKTQRSWDNYVGAEPSREADVNSPVDYVSQWQQLQDRTKARREAEVSNETKWEKLQRESALRKGMRSIRDNSASPSVGPVV